MVGSFEIGFLVREIQGFRHHNHAVEIHSPQLFSTHLASMMPHAMPSKGMGGTFDNVHIQKN